MDDMDLLQELISELDSIKGYYKESGFLLLRLQQIQGLQLTIDVSQPINTLPQNGPQTPNLSVNLIIVLADNDNNSVTSSTTDHNNSSRDPRGLKLIELLIQSHILNGLLDYVVQSVEFFQRQNDTENEKIEKLLRGETNNHYQNDPEHDTSLDNESTESLNEQNNTITEIDHIETDNIESNLDSNDEESVEDKMHRCIQFAADILSIDLWVILNRIIESPKLMDKLWLILYLKDLNESCPTVNHLVHILDQLLNSNSIELLNFIRGRSDLVDTLLDKLEVPIIMDFFLRIIQTDKPDSPTGIIDILYHQSLIPKLIDILKPDDSQFKTGLSFIPNDELFFKQTAATEFIKALITISSNTALAVVVEANIGPNQLTRQLVSKPIVNQMVNDIMLYTKEDPDSNLTLSNKHGINNIVGIIIEVIRKNNSDYDSNCGSYSSMLNTYNSNNETIEVNSYVMFQWLKDFEQNPPNSRDPIFLGEMLAIFSDNLDKFNALIELDPQLPLGVDMDANILGFTRFRISELVAELLHCSNMILINSRKIRKINEIRDKVRDKQTRRLKKALDDDLTSMYHVNVDISLSENFDDISLQENAASAELLEGENNDFDKFVNSLQIDVESNHEESIISSGNPFVCEERNKSIRSNPNLGDYFKIKLKDLNILINIISKFTQYAWHNFFHNVVFDLIQQIFNGKLHSYNSFLISDLFQEEGYNLTKVITRAYRNQDYELRPGYLGHVILISEEVVKFTSLYKPDLISPLILNSVHSDDWNWFVNEILLKTREVYNVVLGADSDDIEEDYGDMNTHIPEIPKFKESMVNHVSDYNEDDVLGDDDDNDDDNLSSTISGVRVQDMSPKPDQMMPDILGDNYDPGIGDFSQNDFLENLSGSSSSDEEENDFNDNKLTRVKKHYS